MLRAAREGKDASSQAAKVREQPNHIFAIHRKDRGYMAKRIDEQFTRSDLIFESIMDSIVDPLPLRRCVSALASANIAVENLFCKGRTSRVNHTNIEPAGSKLKSNLKFARQDIKNGKTGQEGIVGDK